MSLSCKRKDEKNLIPTDCMESNARKIVRGCCCSLSFLFSPRKGYKKTYGGGLETILKDCSALKARTYKKNVKGNSEILVLVNSGAKDRSAVEITIHALALSSLTEQFGLMSFPKQFFFFSTERSEGCGHRKNSEQKLERELFKELEPKKPQTLLSVLAFGERLAF